MFVRMKTFETHTDMPLDDRLRRSVAAWCARHGVSARRFGMDALGDPGFVGSQIRGRSVRLETADRVRAWMAANASEDELRAIRERLADVADPCAGTGDAATGRARNAGNGEGSNCVRDGNIGKPFQNRVGPN